MKKQMALRPQDIVLAIKMSLEKGPAKSNVQMAHELRISPAEAYNSVIRLRSARLLDSEDRPILRNLKNLIVHGIPYFYPAEVGSLVRGISVAHSGPILRDILKQSKDDKYVWPDPDGKELGQAIKPLFKSIPQAAKMDAKLYEVLSLIEALRVGKTRERELAEKHLAGALA